MSLHNQGKVSRDKLELLAMLQNLDVSDETWIEIRRIIADFFAVRATTQANKVVEKEGWTDEDFHRLAHSHMRTPYNRALF